MNAITFALVCTFAITQVKQGSSTPLDTVGAFQHEHDEALKEQVHDKISYIAAIADLQHLKFIEDLKSSKIQPLKTEVAIFKLLREHMINVTKTILPNLENLIDITDDKDHSLQEVSKHFAEDHVNPMLRMIFGEKQPEFYNSLRKRVADFAQAQIRAIFVDRSDHI